MAEINQKTADTFSEPGFAAQAGIASSLTTYSTQELFVNGDEIHILHQGETYRMRITRNRKLILTK